MHPTPRLNSSLSLASILHTLSLLQQQQQQQQQQEVKKIGVSNTSS